MVFFTWYASVLQCCQERRLAIDLSCILSVFQCCGCNTCLNWSFVLLEQYSYSLVFICQLVWKNNCNIMIFVKAVAVNCIFEVMLWCCWKFPSFFYTVVHFKSCARRVRNVKVVCFNDSYLKVIFFSQWRVTVQVTWIQHFVHTAELFFYQFLKLNSVQWLSTIEVAIIFVFLLCFLGIESMKLLFIP